MDKTVKRAVSADDPCATNRKYGANKNIDWRRTNVWGERCADGTSWTESRRSSDGNRSRNRYSLYQGENCCEVGAKLREKPEQIHRTATLVYRRWGTKLTSWVTRAATPRHVNGAGNGRRTKQHDPQDLWRRQKNDARVGQHLERR